MVVTRQGRPTTSGKFPTTQLFFLAICRFAEPIALTSIFPYSWVMVKDFHLVDSNAASLYAGVLISAFSLAEALTGMFWGGLSDRIGRKPVLLLGCFGTMISMLLVGFAPNYWVALLGRAIGGALNGNIGVIQTMVGELVKKPEHEPQAYSVMPFVWSMGTVIGPAIGGILAKPSERYPSLFPPSGLFGEFPYLLPNLVCSALLLISIISGWFFLQETHPMLQAGNAPVDPDDPPAESALLPPAEAEEACLGANSYGTFNQVHKSYADEEQAMQIDSSKAGARSQELCVFTWRVVTLVLALGIFSYHSMNYDNMLPIFLQDEKNTAAGKSVLNIPGGLGLSTQTVGLIMSVDGVIALFVQSLIFPVLAKLLGAWRLFVAVTILHPVVYLIVPLLVFVPQQLLTFGIYVCLIVRNTLHIITYPVLLILIKQASPSDCCLGKINGFAASAGAAARSVAPPVSGFLYSVGLQIGSTAIPWWGSTFVAVVGTLQLCFIDGKPSISPISSEDPFDVSYHSNSDERSSSGNRRSILPFTGLNKLWKMSSQ